MIEFVLLIICLVVLYRWLNERPKNFPPGPPSVPILGSLPFIQTTHFHILLEDLREKYGPIIGMMFGTSPGIAVCGPDEVMEVLKRDDFALRPSLFQKLVTDSALFITNGQKWKQHRRFTLRHLREFGFGKASVNDAIIDEAKRFCEEVMEGKKSVEVSGLFNLSAFNILWKMMAGDRMSYDDPEAYYVLDKIQSAMRQGNLAGGGFINSVPYLKEIVSVFYEVEIDKNFRLLRQFFMKIVNEHIATKTDVPRDFIDVYLTELDNPAKGESFDVDALLGVIRDMISAGAESSSNTISFCILYLMLNPEWQDKLQKEIDANVGKTPPVYEQDRIKCPLTEAFITECIRINSIAPFAVPHSSLNDTTLCGYSVPKDCTVNVSLWSLLMDKKHWGDPKNFRPERFIDSDGAFKKDPFMIAFGAGPRLCIGESLTLRFIFMFLVTLLQRYKFSLPKGAPKPSTLSLPGFTTTPRQFTVEVESR